MRITNSLLLVSVALFLGCSDTPKFLPEAELLKYIQDTDNGLKKEVQAGKVTLSVTYRPDDLLVWQEAEGSDSTQVRAVQDQFDDYIYFLFSMSAGEKDALYGLSQDQATFSENLQTMSFRMAEYVTLTTSNQDTIPVGDFVYNRTFGLSKSNDFLFVFNSEKLPNEPNGWISFNVKEFGFRTGRRSFRFDMANIRRTPRLKELEPFLNRDNRVPTSQNIP